jgi:hypothetical protein
MMSPFLPSQANWRTHIALLGDVFEPDKLVSIQVELLPPRIGSMGNPLQVCSIGVEAWSAENDRSGPHTSSSTKRRQRGTASSGSAREVRKESFSVVCFPDECMPP